MTFNRILAEKTTLKLNGSALIGQAVFEFRYFFIEKEQVGYKPGQNDQYYTHDNVNLTVRTHRIRHFGILRIRYKTHEHQEQEVDKFLHNSDSRIFSSIVL